MNEGMIQGGWEYVWTVFIVTWAVLIGYGISLYIRGRTT